MDVIPTEQASPDVQQQPEAVLDVALEPSRESVQPSKAVATNRDEPERCIRESADQARSLPDSAESESTISRSRDNKLAQESASLNASLNNSSRSFREHRISIDTIPRQTVLKALASRRPPYGNPNLTIVPSISETLAVGEEQMDCKRPLTATTTVSRSLAAPLLELMLESSTTDETPSTARYPIIQSPCFFHQRFDDAVNIEKVLDEIAYDEGMSHSRLMQTATGVREVSKQLQRRPIKRAVKNVMIVTKARDNQLVTLTRELAEWLLGKPRYGSDLGVNVYVDAKLRHSKRFDAADLLEKEPRFEEMLNYWTPDLCWTSPDKFDLVLTLGGDGTVLFTSWLFQRIVPPVLSFSLGSLGFLTNFQFEQYKEHLDRVMGDAGMRVSLRMRFTCTVYRHARRTGEMVEGEQFEVLNELVMDRGPSPYVSNLELYGDDELLTVVQADGCIFSTPTGSTAYSLSAGGSLVHPDIPAILLTPICPHTLSFRPMLLNDTMLLRVCVPRSSRATAYCSFDGKGRVELKQGDYVTIAASQYPFPTVLSSQMEWFNSISRTLRWNTRGAQQKGWSDGGTKTTEDGEDEEEEYDDDVDEADDDQRWDIDTVDSGVYSEESSTTNSAVTPARLKRQMELLMIQ
ncbi:MAG: NAD(+) kinase [Peltula sp. TS41687]|nr:MAG: NAD(+) kinase [Peltula sp. TS41687]